jgi:carbon monoxide dehydrogenase subunit G
MREKARSDIRIPASGTTHCLETLSSGPHPAEADLGLHTCSENRIVTPSSLRKGPDVLIENSFEVPAPIDQVWSYLQDIEKVVPCMPGAELTETMDESNWKGKVTIKLGPVSMAFAGKVTLDQLDEVGHRAVLKASGMEQRGKGAASATITSTLEQSSEGTKVKIVQDLKVSGQAAQFSRGMMQDVSTKLTQEFADCLKANMQVEDQANPGAEPVPMATAKPVQGIRLGLGALWRAVLRFFSRLFGRSRE